MRTIVEYAGDRSVPIVSGPGDSTVETFTTALWWRNESKPPVELFSADFFPE